MVTFLAPINKITLCMNVLLNSQFESRKSAPVVISLSAPRKGSYRRRRE